MWIERDITALLKGDKGTFAQILIGPRQCGKSTQFAALGQGKLQEVTFDDFQMRDLAERDPALFLSQYTPPLIIDEVQYAPNIFPEIKKWIDQLKKKRVFEDVQEPIEVLFYLTGSNQILLDEEVKETLVGRASYYHMNTLSVHEIYRAYPNISMNKVIFQGGWPEIYTNEELDPTRYLSDYVRNFIEKDIVVSAGIVKKKEFHTVLGMLAARTGNILNCSSLAKDSGVKSVTVNEWVSILEQTELLFLLPPVESNLNKRLIRSPKIYYLDTGLATYLQGWVDVHPLLKSPQAGALFETLVLAEIVKCKLNFGKKWKISMWRTKDGEEIDFIIENGRGDVVALDAKLGIHGAQAVEIPRHLANAFPQIDFIGVVTYEGKKLRLSKQCIQLPLTELTPYLLAWDH